MGSNWLVLLKYLEVIESFLTIEILQNHRTISWRGIERKDSPPPLLPMR